MEDDACNALLLCKSGDDSCTSTACKRHENSKREERSASIPKMLHKLPGRHGRFRLGFLCEVTVIMYDVKIEKSTNRESLSRTVLLFSHMQINPIRRVLTPINGFGPDGPDQDPCISSEAEIDI